MIFVSLPWTTFFIDLRPCSVETACSYHRFEEGLRFEDERSLTDAMGSLRLYPDDVSNLVENTVMGWLFGAREEDVA